MRNTLIAFCGVLVAANSFAQTLPLPKAASWADAKTFRLLDSSGAVKFYDAKTGKPLPSYVPTIEKVAGKGSVEIKKKDVFYKLNGVETQLTNDAAEEKNATLSPDGNYVAFTKNNDLYTIDVATKKLNRLTNDGSDMVLNGYASWVYMEEILGRDSKYRSFWWSPDSKHIAFFRFDESGVPVFTTSDADSVDLFTESIRYPKVGDKNPEVRVGIVAADGGKTTWADFDEKNDQYFGLPYWKPDGKALLVQWMNRLQNELKIFSVDASTGEKNIFFTETQKTWISLNDLKRIRFLENGKAFILESDATGWNHLYLYDINGKLVNRITTGNFTVTNVDAIDEKNNKVYFTARGIENTARKDLYVVGMNGKGLKRLSFGNYHFTPYAFSADKKYLATRFSNATTPDKIAIIATNGSGSKVVFDSKDAAYDFATLPKMEVVRVKSDDGLFDLPMKVIWPKNMEKGKSYPVWISIYGGPDAGTVWDSWAITKTQNAYAADGLIQVQMDHRASGQFGKAGVNYMFHNLGDWELKDYATMVRWLVANGQADAKRIGITGFSYGGYLTALALTKYADVFTHGIAGGSVVDWRMYDSHYTERVMGTPANNPEGYKASSVLNYVKNYKGKLLLVHGLIDENVHPQNSFWLSAALQDAGKDFEMMYYSKGRHGWRNLPIRWKHYENLVVKFVYENMIGKEAPGELLK